MLKIPAATVIATLVASCGGDPPPSDVDADDGGFDRSAMLAHLSSELIAPIQSDFAVAAAALPPAIDAHCAVLDAGGDPAATLDAARAAWRSAVDVWQRADAVLVGPAAMDSRTIRSRIYAWPLFASCSVDRDTALIWIDPPSYDVTTRLDNARSLTAIEYLLYTTETAHTCAVEPTGWGTLAADLPRARCRLASAIAADVRAQADGLAAAWANGYTAELAGAGVPPSTIPTAHEGVNRVSDSLFYADRIVKDMKLGEAAGIVANACGTVQMPCDREVELRFADRGTFAIRINLATLRAAFTGTVDATTDGPAFDDFLAAVGASDVAARMVGEIDAAIALAAALPDSYATALSANYADVVALHAATKAITDDLKSQFLTLLALEIPDDVAADND
jgi:hypothetical protein